MAHLEVDPITRKIIGCAFRVSNVLGCRFVEKVYENALAHELRKAGLRVAQQHPMQVWYEEVQVGEFWADLVVEEAVVVELKAVRELIENHRAQCLNYLHASHLPVCLLINFGNPKVQVERISL